MQDILNRPVQVGDTVLTKDYYSTILNKITTVKKITKYGILIDLDVWDYSSQSYKPKAMKRDRNSFVVINEQLAYNKETFPEFYI